MRYVEVLEQCLGRKAKLDLLPLQAGDVLETIADVSRLEAKIRDGDFSEADMRRCQQLEWDYARALLSQPLAQSFTVITLTNFDWQPDAYAHLGKRGDIINK